MQVGRGRRLGGVPGLLQRERLGGLGALAPLPAAPQALRAVPQPERTRR